ncbi:sensor histidine kinase [Agaribacter flavus]|uniref:histidine kinase n=1 Tax=Agaribacter flavus TaxID=1902781 RepID=A0ABV7FMM4_9ALTE
MRAIKAYSKSSSFLVSFIFTFLLFVGVAFNTYVLSVSNDDLLIRETEAAILADIGGFRSLYESAGQSAVIAALENRLKNRNNDFLYYLKNADDEFIAGNLKDWPESDVKLIRNGLLEIEVSTRTSNEHDTPSDAQTAIAMIVAFSNQDNLLIARSVQNYEFAVWLAQTSSWVMIIIVCIISILSLAVAYYVVSRINKISDTADEIISSGNLSERLYVESDWDDLSKLTVSLNLMLDKLEQSVNGIRSVSDNIAHDLRTPLTRLKTHLEQLKEDELKHNLIAECDNILAIFNSLLRITYIETNAKREGFEQSNLSLVLEDAIDLYQPILEEKHIELSTDIGNDLYAICDKSLIFQVFTNLIDNASKFTPAKGSIKLVLSQQGNNVFFSVCDSGIGVDDAALSKLTQRFYRADKSRTARGNGLGLSLVSAVVALHLGEMSFSNSTIADTGLCCKITIPCK